MCAGRKGRWLTERDHEGHEARHNTAQIKTESPKRLIERSGAFLFVRQGVNGVRAGGFEGLISYGEEGDEECGDGY